MERALLAVVVMTFMAVAVVPTPSKAPEWKAADSWRKVGTVRTVMTKTSTNLTDQPTNNGRPPSRLLSMSRAVAETLMMKTIRTTPT